MEPTVLGGAGGWPRAGQACSGYLVQHDGYRLLIDPGYGVFGELLRARVLGLTECAPLPVLAPTGSLAALLALDPVQWVAGGADPITIDGESKINFGPFAVYPIELRHHVTTFGFRISSSDGAVLAYTAASGDSPDRVHLALDAGHPDGDRADPRQSEPGGRRPALMV